MNGRQCSERPSLLAHREVVLERRVRLLERVLELVALEDVVARLRRLAVPELRIDDPADRPHGAGLPLDPDDDPLLPTGVVDPVEHPLRKPPRSEETCTARLYNRPVLRLGSFLRNPVLVSLHAQLGRGAGRLVRDARAPAGPPPRGDPPGPLRPEPPDAAAAGPAARTARRRARARRAGHRRRAAVPRHAASSTTRAATATSHAASPFDLKTTMSSSDCRPGISPATTSCSSCTSSQSSVPPSTGSIRSADSSFASSSESQQTKLARSRTTLSSSRRFPSFAPTAQTSAPGCSHSPRSTGSGEPVTVTTMSHCAGSRVALAGLGVVRARRTRAASTRCGSTRRRARFRARPRGCTRPATPPASRSRSRRASTRPSARDAWPRPHSPHRCAAVRACRRRSPRRARVRRCGRAARRSARLPGSRHTPSRRRSRARGRRPT